MTSCLHIFSQLNAIESSWTIDFYYQCQECKEVRKEVFEKETNQIIEVEILKVGMKK